jgi:DNA-binding transcriptional LysR family regulator
VRRLLRKVDTERTNEFTMPARINLDLNLLRIAVALLDAGSVSQAAKRLGLSQSSVSESLAKLRGHFDDALFVRTVNGMSPTPLGAEIGTSARDILQDVEEKLGTRVPFDPVQRHRPFTFAMSDVGEIVFLPRLAKAFAEISPETPIRSVSMRPYELTKAMTNGDVDLAVGFFPDLKRGEFFQRRLFTHHFVCLIRSDHPVTGTTLTMKQFLALPHAVVLSEGRSQEILEGYLAQNGLVRKVAIYTPHFLSIPTLIARSDMVVTVPHAMGISYGKPSFRLRVMQLPFESPRIQLRQHWHIKFHKDSRNTWLRGIVSDLFNETSDEWQPSSLSALASAAVQT